MGHLGRTNAGKWPGHHAAARHARGFAMPLVVIFAMIAGVIGAIVLHRQASQSYVVERQVHSYRTTHFERGLREVVGAWTNSLVGQPIERMIGEGGHTLDLELPNGGWASLYLFDGQGSLVSTPAGLTEQQRADMAGIMQQLEGITGGDVDPAWFRPVGPVRVSAATAPPEVLEAIAAYAGSRNPRRLSQSILDARESGDLTQPDLETAYNSAGLNPEQRNIMNRLLLLRPELWAMVVEVFEEDSRGQPVLVARYLGRFSLPAAGGARATMSLSSLGQFLSWEELPLE